MYFAYSRCHVIFLCCSSFINLLLRLWFHYKLYVRPFSLSGERFPLYNINPFHNCSNNIFWSNAPKRSRTGRYYYSIYCLHTDTEVNPKLSGCLSPPPGRQFIANPVPIHRQSLTNLPRFTNMAIQCQSINNPPIQVQSHENLPIQCQCANPTPICQSNANMSIQRQSTNP